MKPKCIFWKDCGVPGGGCCRIGRHGGRPSFGTCQVCSDYRGRPRGWGDWVHIFARPIGYVLNRMSNGRLYSPTKCQCQQRRQKWNSRPRRDAV